jgi:hypothetical protein
MAAQVAGACWMNALFVFGSEAAVLAERPEAVADKEMCEWGGD